MCAMCILLVSIKVLYIDYDGYIGWTNTISHNVIEETPRIFSKYRMSIAHYKYTCPPYSKTNMNMAIHAHCTHYIKYIKHHTHTHTHIN